MPVDFRSAHQSRWERCWRNGICQVCAQPLDAPPYVFLGGPDQIAHYFTEPPLHPWCAAYVTQACPMVVGRMAVSDTGGRLLGGRLLGGIPQGIRRQRLISSPHEHEEVRP